MATHTGPEKGKRESWYDFGFREATGHIPASAPYQPGNRHHDEYLAGYADGEEQNRINEERANASYRTEFPDFDPATMPAIPAGWQDTSWHNDACPSFQSGALRVFVDYAEPQARELADAPRYSVHLWEGDCPVIHAGDDWAKVLDCVARATREGAAA